MADGAHFLVVLNVLQFFFLSFKNLVIMVYYISFFLVVTFFLWVEGFKSANEIPLVGSVLPIIELCFSPIPWACICYFQLQ